MTSLQPEKLDLNSLNIAEDNRAKLKALFPSVFAETRDDQGELVESIDFEKLRAELGSFSDVFENRRERYGMEWPGKKDCIKLVQQPATGTLKPCREESVNFDSTENLFIEGDNLEVLKLLQKSYYGKVKMIYIDPPYNTGKEFIYPDHYAETLETYLAYAGLMDADGKKFSTNTANEGRFHTKWLNMMYPRLYLAKNLLREDGVIFVSIDDNEVSNLRKLCDEIYGEENFVANVVWQKKYAVSSDSKGIPPLHDHILVFRKSVEFIPNLLPRTDKQNSAYKNLDNDPRGVWRPNNLTRSEYRERDYYPIRSPKSGEVFYPPKGCSWRHPPDVMHQLIDDNRIWFGLDGNSRPVPKLFLSEVRQGIVASGWWPHSEAGHNDESTKELQSLFEGDCPFDTPKPSRLVKLMLAIATQPNSDDIVLDFFSGSSTTAHAVLRKNEEDRGNRRFLMVQLPEVCNKKSNAVRLGYENIAEISMERIRRVIREIEIERIGKEEIAKEMIPTMSDLPLNTDLGFKVLKLDRSNFKPWDGSNPNATAAELTQQLELHIDHIDPTATPEDILYELLLTAGFMPTEKIEKRQLAEKNVYAISDGALLICLEDEITRELIDAVAAAEPLQFLCLDKAFNGNDQLKANAVQTFNALNQARDKAIPILFKTV